MALGKYLTESKRRWNRILRRGVYSVCACVCKHQVFFFLVVVVALFCHGCHGWQWQQIAFWFRHLWFERLRQHFCIRPTCLFFLAIYMWCYLKRVMQVSAGTGRIFDFISAIYFNVDPIRNFQFQLNKGSSCAFPVKLKKVQYLLF